MTKRSMNRRKFVSYSAAVGTGAVIAAKAGGGAATAAAPAVPARTMAAWAAQDLSQVKFSKAIETVPVRLEASDVRVVESALVWVPTS